MRVLLRPLAWLAALALLPACWAATAALARTLPEAFLRPGGSILTPEGWALLGGALLYALWHRVRPPEFLYTFAHELTHLLFALLWGKRVSRFEVSRGSGEVALSGTNPLITLAPYFFPLPAAGVLLLGTLAEWAWGEPRLRLGTAALAGLALALHVGMTWRALGSAQPDIERGGRLFSWAVIYLAGALFVGGAALWAAGGGGALLAFGRRLGEEIFWAYAWAGPRLLEALDRGAAWVSERWGA